MKEDTSNEEVVEETAVEDSAPDTTDSEPSGEQTEPHVNEQPLYAGKYKSPEELERAYQEAQKLISLQGSKLKQFEQPELPANKQEILKELKSLGVMTKDEFQKEQAVELQRTKDEREIQALQLTESQANALKRYASHRDNLSKSMTECWDELTGTIGGKVVSRKTTIKPKIGSKTGFIEKTSEELARLPEDEYNKYWADYTANKANNI